MSTSFFYRKFSCYVLHGRDIGVGGGAGKVFYRRTASNHPPPAEIDCRQFLSNTNFSQTEELNPVKTVSKTD